MTQDNPISPPPAPAPSDPAEFFVPYKNGYALLAYYLGIFSFIPVLGILLGIPAFFCGLKGLKLAREHPEARGKIHAWIGIIVGGLFGFGYLLLVILLAALMVPAMLF